MSKIKITTLTSVHIGSGNELHHGLDFVSCNYQGNDMLALADIRKAAELIGAQNVQTWVTGIENGRTIDSIVQQFAPHKSVADYAKRMILQWADIEPTDTIKEQIHDGRGVPYIPGSSIKGAIRTAVLASSVKSLSDIENKLQNKHGKTTAEQVERELFGSNAKKDIFRFLQVGDAYFGKNYEVAVRLVNLNNRKRQGIWDENHHQLIEAIGPEDTSEFQLRLNMTGYNLSRNKGKVKDIPECMCSLPVLFETINANTIRLLSTEKEYREKCKDPDDLEIVDEYLERIDEMQDVANRCKKGEECVLRIGHGSGWRFITGAWTEKLDNFAEAIVPKCRRNNKNYEEYDFPKTRRVDDQCQLLGFVKLSM